MPYFDYSAIDRQGNSVNGQIQAANRDEAALNLTRTGLLVSRLTEANAKPSAAPPRPAPTINQATQSTPRPMPAATAQPQQRVTSSAPPATARQQPVKSKPSFVRTKAGTDKDTYVVFSQLQSYAKSGVNPVEALTNVGNACHRADFKEALLAAADAAKEGKPISDVFERYTDLFPPHVVGMTRAAEHGGFFPEAYDFITDQAHASHKFRIWFKWLLGVAIMVGACIPIAWLAVRAASASWDANMKSGGSGNGWSTFFASMWKVTVWPCAPVIAVLVIGTWIFARSWQARPMREKRHRLALLVPTVGKRAKSESIAVFSWTMSMLAKTGLSPRSVWELSTGTMPNLEMKRQMDETGRRMSESTRLSEAMTMNRTLPEEYAPIVQTGEVTGDIPGALARASQSQLEEFKAGDQASKVRVGCWMLLLIVVGSLVMLWLVYGVLYGEITNKITSEEGFVIPIG